MPNRPIGCLGFFLRFLGVQENATTPTTSLPKVQVNKYFVSDAEGNFFRVLQKLVGDRGHVLAQVTQPPKLGVQMHTPAIKSSIGAPPALFSAEGRK